ncbi:carbohydrate ABC transporter permease [Streptacidiphilus carbonis]|jgi:N,N'-diacetylchitobiose transport system permease protein|uniref:carbohydrate ABC transporter permease n=1 Tax=Streptacidiphilus carbonis TaxID=105422 RepID=UPI0005AA6392|nr:sugar ABC transporter permease [Streptacidiphilus carbonis]
MAVQSSGAQAGIRDDGSAADPVQAASGAVGGGSVVESPRRAGKPGRGFNLSGGTPYLLLLPALVATLALLVYPAVREIIISFQKLNAFQLIQHTTSWTGFGNYQTILTSADFWHTTERSVLFTLANVGLIMIGGTLVGLLLNRLGNKMRFTLSLALVFAWAMPVLAGTTVFQWLFDQQFGVVDWLLSKLGWHSMAHYDWLSSQFSTFTVITLLIVWQSIPFVAFNLYAGLTTISSEIFEAARMDGAGPFRVFRSVVFPILKPFFLSTVFLEIIWVFGALPQVLAINGGGPQGSTATLPVYAYLVGVSGQHYGMGAAVAVVTIVMLCLMMSYYFRIILKQEDEL